jgi:hypothetical protein
VTPWFNSVRSPDSRTTRSDVLIVNRARHTFAAALLALAAAAPLVRATSPVERAEPPPPATERPAADAATAAPTVPHQAAATLDADAMRAAFADLNHADAAVRDRAIVRLMGMGRDNLDAFRRIVDQSRPLLPSQAAVLRQVVAQAYLSGEPYPAIHRAGFLGVRMQMVAVASPADGLAHANVGAELRRPNEFPPADPRTQMGIVIVERMPGFSGARSLQDGDVILNVVGQPLRMTADRSDREILNDFSVTVRDVGDGNTVTFELIRQGRVMRVPVRLDPRPEAADPAFGGGVGTIEELLNRRRQKADSYWNEAFRPLMGERVG